MKNLIHFGQKRDLPVPEGERADSGNGYYSYNWIEIPYSGLVTPENESSVYTAINDRFYTRSLMSVSSFSIKPNSDLTGGVIVVKLCYHHGE